MSDEYFEITKAMNKDTAEQAEYKKVGAKIERSRKEYDNWTTQSDRIYDAFVNKNKPGSSKSEDKTSPIDYNIIWETHGLTKEAYYARPPITIIQLRQGFENHTTKAAKIIAKRNLDYFINNPDSDFNYNMQACRDDFKLIGRAIPWVTYAPENYTEDIEVEQEEGYEGEPEYTQEEFLKAEGVEVEYVMYKDYAQSPARREKEITWKARRTYHTKAEMAEEFGKEIADALIFVKKHEDDEVSDSDMERENIACEVAEVWEIWDKPSNKVMYWCEQYKEGLLKKIDPPCKFKKFWPTPRALLGTTTPKTMVPVADATILKYYVESIDTITTRIANITKAIKVFGVHDPSLASMADLFEDSENYLKPLPSWTKFMESGKFDGAVSMFPIEQYVNALQNLNMQKDRLLADYARLSGTSSLMRGEAQMNESAPSAQARARFADLRLAADQKEMQRFCRDCIALMADVIFQKFEPDTLIAISGIDYEAEDAEFTKDDLYDAVDLLKDEINYSLAIEIQTDSTLAINGEAERQDRMEFLNASINSTQAAISASEQLPEFMEPITKTLQFVIDSFPSAQPVDISYADAIEEYKKRKEQEAMQEPAPDPDMMKLQMEQQIAQSKLQIDGQEAQAKAGQAAQDSQMKFQIKQQEMQFDYQKLQVQSQMQMQEFQNKMQLQYEETQQKLMLLREEMMVKSQLKQQETQTNAQLKVAEIKTNAETQQQETMIKAQQQAEKDMLDREADLKKKAMETEASTQATLIQAQAELAKGESEGEKKIAEATPTKEPQAAPQPINVNVTVEKGGGKKVGKINKETGEVTVEDVNE